MNAAQAEPSRPRIRPSRSGRRRAFVLGGVHLLLFAHLLHWWWSGRTLTPLEPSEGMEFSKQGVVNAGLLFFAAAGLSTLVFGRYFCGWACHLVALQDLCRWMLLKVGIRPKPLRSRALLWVPAGAFLYMFVWPLLYRSWVGDDLGVRAVHLTTTSFWATFPGPIVAVVTFLVCGFAAVYFLGAKGFCTYACPYGALFGAVDRFAPGRIRVTDACEGCGHCTAVCSSNVVVHAEVRDFGMVVDPGCMKCMDCVSVCPNDALYFGFGRPAAFAAPRVAVPSVRKAEHGWREEAALGALFLLAFTAFRGLYGVVPFLLALGLGAIVACLALQALRMIYRRDVRLARWVLKSGGRLRPAGRCFAVGMLL
ncbi:MAG TPA: 4Fe-4S binding protein, partial [Planctomycetota bacterium]